MKKVLKKIIRFPWVVCKAFWEVLKYIWENKKRLLIPFLLGEATYWLPIALVIVASILTRNPVWAASFWGFYVGVIPAIPCQIVCTFVWYFIFVKLKGRKNNEGIKDECNKLIQRIKKIS